MRMKMLVLLILAIFITNLAYGNLAFGYEAESDQALQQTQRLLKNKNLRDQAVNESPAAQRAHQRAQDLLKNPENLEKAYGMAAQMMEQIMKEAQGDPEKAQSILNKGLEDPASLADRMPAQFKEMLKDVGGGIEGISNTDPQ